jgi:hypothetical protein
MTLIPLLFDTQNIQSNATFLTITRKLPRRVDSTAGGRSGRKPRENKSLADS